MKYLKNIEKKIILTLLNTTLQAGNILPKYNKYTRYFSLGQRNKLFIFNLKYSFYQIKKSFLFILELAALRQKILFINLDNNVKFERFIDTKKFSSTRLNVFTSFFIRNKIVYVSGEWRPGSISNIQQHVRSPDIKWKNLYKGLYGLNNRKIYPYEHISLRRSYSYKTSWEETKKRKKLKKRLDVCVIPYIGAYKWYYKLFRKIAFKNFKSRYIPLVASESIIKQSKIGRVLGKGQKKN